MLERRLSAGGKPGQEEKDSDMIKLNETSSANVSLVGQDELTQVVGVCCFRPRRYHCGGWRRRDYDNYGYGKGKRDYGYEDEGYKSEGSEGGDDYESEYGGDTQIANVAVTVNIAQV